MTLGRDRDGREQLEWTHHVRGADDDDEALFLELPLVKKLTFARG